MNQSQDNYPSPKYQPKNTSFRDILSALELELNNSDDNQEISLYTQPIPEPPCVLLRWRFLVQAQFYTHMGYTLHIEQHQENTSSNDTIEIKNV